MAAPSINTTTSVLGYKQWQAWEYQPYATNSPASWDCPNLPAGLTINSTTGKISGAAEVAGVFVCGLTATNGDGTSAALILTIGIEEASAMLTDSGLQVEIDVIARVARVVGAAAGGGGAATGQAFFARENDSLLLWITFKKGDVVLDLDIESLEIAVKELEPESRIVLGTEWKKYGSGTGAYYGLYAEVSGDALKSSLSSYEADGGTSFDALAEIGWTETNPDTGDFGPAAFQFSTQDFALKIARDMGA